ncbi:hypothetical protein [Methylobacterium oryzihabitans]|uniref:Glycine zipper 2TM domain-containing protein n=1 Tax=Methylobacterium oryzihabitans TaxID=2499852 RepID=A0A437P4Z5_9HYPH|nr:hypothetical protein [Methylobacterium oryzihabitans]RVU17218.1 hypothetical protein EOE48_15065 [Methylobacterium oryzihabitans]
MRIVAKAAVVTAVTLLGVGAAEAKGCIKGAIIGGVAGHYLADRGVIGAVAGCLGGRYIANRRAKQRELEYGARVRSRDAGYGAPGGVGRRNYAY